MDMASDFAKKTVNAELIFEKFLLQYNPEFEQQDACDFLNCLLDNIHEELKTVYVPQYSKQVRQTLKGDGDPPNGDWTDTRFKTTSVQHNQE